jgi:hypothetical protein
MFHAWLIGNLLPPAKEHAVKPLNLSVKTRTAIAFGASMGVAHAAFRAFAATFGPIAGGALGIFFTAIVTFGIYWAMGISLRSSTSAS